MKEFLKWYKTEALPTILIFTTIITVFISVIGVLYSLVSGDGNWFWWIIALVFSTMVLVPITVYFSD